MCLLLLAIKTHPVYQSLIVSDGSWAILVTQPISAVFLGVTALIVMRKAYVLVIKKDND